MYEVGCTRFENHEIRREEEEEEEEADVKATERNGRGNGGRGNEGWNNRSICLLSSFVPSFSCPLEFSLSFSLSARATERALIPCNWTSSGTGKAESSESETREKERERERRTRGNNLRLLRGTWNGESRPAYPIPLFRLFHSSLSFSWLLIRSSRNDTLFFVSFIFSLRSFSFHSTTTTV